MNRSLLDRPITNTTRVMKSAQATVLLNGETWRVHAHYGIADRFPGQQAPRFTLNGEGFLRTESGRFEDEPDIAGQIQELLLTAFPGLALMAVMHLRSAVDGAPVHAVENGWYWLTSPLRSDAHTVLGWEDMTGPQRAAAYLGCGPDAFESITPTSTDDQLMRAEFIRRVDLLRPTWAAMAALTKSLYGLDTN